VKSEKRNKAEKDRIKSREKNKKNIRGETRQKTKIMEK
jgi:hypothetical protein